MAILRASAGEGGWNKVVGGSSVFTLSALAVDNEIVGSDNEGELICCEGEFWKACCCARSAAVAVCVSLFALGEVEKKLDSLVTLGEDDLRGSSWVSM